LHLKMVFEHTSALGFNHNGVLFIGDSKRGTITAVEIGDGGVSEYVSKPYNLVGLDRKVAGLLGTTSDQLLFKGLASNPLGARDVYLAVQRGQSPVLLKVTQAGEVSVFDISKHKSSEIALPNLIKPGTTSTAGAKEDLRSLSITDIKFFKDEVFVSGISNAEFSSTLFKLSYPFKEGDVTVNSIQMYHSVHGMFETRAPIRAMTILPLNDEPHVLAAYLCTPLVTIPLASLNGQHAKAKTIAELGFGNIPVTVLRFQSQDWHGNKVDNILITHKNRGPQLFDVQTIEHENQKEGIERHTQMELIIPKHTDVPLTGLTHVGDLDQQF